MAPKKSILKKASLQSIVEGEPGKDDHNPIFQNVVGFLTFQILAENTKENLESWNDWWCYDNRATYRSYSPIPRMETRSLFIVVVETLISPIT